jgi:3-hydroxyisobutyrate dehydrogenase-like beta-hydroxyacid dehydrogenase
VDLKQAAFTGSRIWQAGFPPVISRDATRKLWQVRGSRTAEGETNVKIAFLGLGAMGAPMALNLCRAGHTLTVFNRTAAKAIPLVEAGAAQAASPAAAVEGVDIVVTMVSNDQAVREALFASSPPRRPALDVLPAGAVHICTSTIGAAFSRQLAGEHAARGQGYVAAPVLGRPDAAAEKRLWVIAAGPGDQIERCRPVFDAIGRGCSVVADEPSQANVAKIMANFMLASVLEAMAEAFTLVRKSGMESRVFVEILNALFNSPVYANYGRMVANRQFEPAGFRLALGLKDVGLALEASQDVAAPLPLASVIRDHFLSAVAHGRENADWSALAEVAGRAAGLDGSRA